MDEAQDEDGREEEDDEREFLAGVETEDEDEEPACEGKGSTIKYVTKKEVT